MRILRSRRAAISTLACAATLSLAACGTSFDAETNRRYDAGIGTNVQGTPVEIHHGLFVANSDDSATFSGALINKSGGTQKLEDVVATVDGQEVAIDLSGPITLQDGKLYTTGESADIVLGDDVPPGTFVDLTMTFDRAGEVSIEVPIVERTAGYREIAPGPTAAPSPSLSEPSEEPNVLSEG